MLKLIKVPCFKITVCFSAVSVFGDTAAVLETALRCASQSYNCFPCKHRLRNSKWKLQSDHLETAVITQPRRHHHIDHLVAIAFCGSDLVSRKCAKKMLSAKNLHAQFSRRTCFVSFFCRYRRSIGTRRGEKADRLRETDRGKREREEKYLGEKVLSGRFLGVGSFSPRGEATTTSAKKSINRFRSRFTILKRRL